MPVSEFKERPILFSGPMIRAILEDRKFQTRRIVKKILPTGFEHPFSGLLEADCIIDHDHLPSRLDMMSRGTDLCPKGVPGERLWVRESFQPLLADGVAWRNADYKTGEGYAVRYVATDGATEFYDHGIDAITDRCRPSIFMPRWASRITLEITEVRVQRLQDISHRDALDEGVEYDVSKEDGAPLARYKSLWETINGKNSWNDNPWVWAISFCKI